MDLKFSSFYYAIERIIMWVGRFIFGIYAHWNIFAVRCLSPNHENMMDGWINGWTDVWIDRWVDGWTDGWMDMKKVCYFALYAY